VGRQLVVDVEGASTLQELVADAVRQGVAVARVAPRSETLEDLFVREAIEAEG
jgi:hypothetical protein